MDLHPAGKPNRHRYEKCSRRCIGHKSAHDPCRAHQDPIELVLIGAHRPQDTACQQLNDARPDQRSGQDQQPQDHDSGITAESLKGDFGWQDSQQDQRQHHAQRNHICRDGLYREEHQRSNDDDEEQNDWKGHQEAFFHLKQVLPIIYVNRNGDEAVGNINEVFNVKWMRRFRCKECLFSSFKMPGV
jgi:hypothetical protein